MVLGFAARLRRLSSVSFVFPLSLGLSRSLRLERWHWLYGYLCDSNVLCVVVEEPGRPQPPAPRGCRYAGELRIRMSKDGPLIVMPRAVAEALGIREGDAIVIVRMGGRGFCLGKAEKIREIAEAAKRLAEELGGEMEKERRGRR